MYEFDYISALEVSDDESIAKHISRQTNFDYDGAVKSGASPDAIIDHLFKTGQVNMPSQVEAIPGSMPIEDKAKISSYVSEYNKANPSKPISYGDIPSRPGIFGTAKELASGIYAGIVDTAPEQLARAYRNFTDGYNPNSNTATSRFIEEQQRDASGRVQSVERILGQEPQTGAYSGGQNIPLSVATMAPGVLASPFVSPVGGVAISSAITLPVFYGAEKDSFFEDVGKAFIQDKGRNPTNEEWKTIHDTVNSAATESGLWESGTEAAGQAFSMLLFGSPVGKYVGKLITKVPGKTGAISRFVGKMAADYTEEVGGETAAQYNEERLRKEVGLKGHETTWGKSFKDVAIPTAFATGVQGAALQIAESLKNKNKPTKDQAPPIITDEQAIIQKSQDVDNLNKMSEALNSTDPKINITPEQALALKGNPRFAHLSTEIDKLVSDFQAIQEPDIKKQKEIQAIKNKIAITKTKKTPTPKDLETISTLETKLAEINNISKESDQFENFLDDTGIVPTDEEKQWTADIQKQKADKIVADKKAIEQAAIEKEAAQINAWADEAIEKDITSFDIINREKLGTKEFKALSAAIEAKQATPDVSTQAAWSEMAPAIQPTEQKELNLPPSETVKPNFQPGEEVTWKKDGRLQAGTIYKESGDAGKWIIKTGMGMQLTLPEDRIISGKQPTEPLPAADTAIPKATESKPAAKGTMFHSTNSKAAIEKSGFTIDETQSSTKPVGVWFTTQKQKGFGDEVIEADIPDNLYKISSMDMDVLKKEALSEYPDMATGNAITKHLVNKGYDGLDMDGNIVVFDPSKIKTKADTAIQEGAKAEPDGKVTGKELRDRYIKESMKGDTVQIGGMGMPQKRVKSDFEIEAGKLYEGKTTKDLMEKKYNLYIGKGKNKRIVKTVEEINKLNGTNFTEETWKAELEKFSKQASDLIDKAFDDYAANLNQANTPQDSLKPENQGMGEQGKQTKAEIGKAIDEFFGTPNKKVITKKITELETAKEQYKDDPEFLKQIDAKISELEKLLTPEKKPTELKTGVKSYTVKQAIQQGKPVPENVLKDYPELSKQAPEAEPDIIIWESADSLRKLSTKKLNEISESYLKLREKTGRTVENLLPKSITPTGGGAKLFGHPFALPDPGFEFIETVERDGKKIDLYVYESASENEEKDGWIIRPHNQQEIDYWEIRAIEQYPNLMPEMADNIAKFEKSYGKGSFIGFENDLLENKTKSLQTKGQKAIAAPSKQAPKAEPTSKEALPVFKDKYNSGRQATKDLNAWLDKNIKEGYAIEDTGDEKTFGYYNNQVVFPLKDGRKVYTEVSDDNTTVTVKEVKDSDITPVDLNRKYNPMLESGGGMGSTKASKEVTGEQTKVKGNWIPLGKGIQQFRTKDGMTLGEIVNTKLSYGNNVLNKFETSDGERFATSKEAKAHEMESKIAPLDKEYAPDVEAKDPLEKYRIEEEKKVARNAKIKKSVEKEDMPILMQTEMWKGKERISGVMIHKSTKKPGGYQLTRWDDRGFSGDSYYNTKSEAIDAALDEGNITPGKDAFNKISKTKEFKDGNKAAEETQKWNQEQDEKRNAGNGTQKYDGFLKLAADTSADLRPVDVDRVMDAANDAGQVDGFKKWLLSKDLQSRTKDKVSAWQVEEDIEITGKQDKTVKVDMPAKDANALKPKEQKAYLLKEIDVAIKAAPDVEAPYHDKKAIRKAEGDLIIANKREFADEIEAAKKALNELTKGYTDFEKITIEVPGDGEFTLLNTKESLKAFKKKISGFPATDVVGQKKVSLPGTKALNKRIIDFSGEYSKPYVPKKSTQLIEATEGKDFAGWYGDGFYIPGQYAVKMPKPATNRPLKEAPEAFKTDILGIDSRDLYEAEIGNETYRNPGDDRSGMILYASASSSEMPTQKGYKPKNNYNPEILDIILGKFPKAKPFMNKDGNLYFLDDGDIVGLVMPVRIADIDGAQFSTTDDFAKPEIKKVKSFKTDEGKFSIYDTEKDVRGRVQMFTVLEDKGGYIVRNAFVPKELQRKGIATEFYKTINEESLKKTGKPLRSTRPRKLITGETVHELTQDAIDMWDSFVKKGLAEKTGTKLYNFKDPTKFSTTDDFEKNESLESYIDQNIKTPFKYTDNRYRWSFPKVRGGWTKDKIKKQLRNISSDKTQISFLREIMKFNSPKELEENLFYHGSGGGISALKPSIVLKYVSEYGGGYGEKYWGISLSKDRNMASNFTGQGRYGNVAPVILKKGAVIKTMPEIEDASEIEDIIEQLWDEGIDAVKINDWTKEGSEQEIVILNPKAIAVGEPSSFQVFNKKKQPSFTQDQIGDLYNTSLEKYNKEIAENRKRHAETFFQKYGKQPATSTTNRYQNIIDRFKEVKKLTQKFEKTQGKFSTTDDLTQPGQGLTPEQIQAQFPGTKTFVQDGIISIRFPNGKGTRILSTQALPDGTVQYALDSGRMSSTGKIMGATINSDIYLDPDIAGKPTLWHEQKHLYDNLGMIRPQENVLLMQEYRKLKQEGKLDFNPSELADPKKARDENSANMFAQVMDTRENYRKTKLGAMIQRILDFLDGIRFIGRSSLRKLARSAETGKIFSRKSDGKKPGIVNIGKGKAWGIQVNKDFQVDTWHGSPHYIEGGFRNDKIGTGEGAQAFGWGHYFTESKKVGKSYAKGKNPDRNLIMDSLKTLTDEQLKTFKESYLDTGGEYGLSPDELNTPREDFYDQIDMDLEMGSWIEIDAIGRAFDKAGVPLPKQAAYLYKTTLHKGKTPDDYNYIEWDKDITIDQARAIKQAIFDEGLDKKFGYGQGQDILPVFAGRDIYRALSNVAGTDKDASRILKEAGISGIKYPAGTLSGGNKSGAYNYVVFDPKDITIEEHIQFDAKEPTNILSKAFKKFFQGSYATDTLEPGGKPLVLYHGTPNKEFMTFDPQETDGDVFFFTDDKEKSKIYGDRVIEAYLSLQNPLVYDYEGYDDGELHRDIRKYKSGGEYDGIIALNISDGVNIYNQYVAFEPTQIKSIYNQGTWDATNPDIRYQTTEDFLKSLDAGKTETIQKTDSLSTGETLAAELEADRTFANQIHEEKAEAVLEVDRKTTILERAVKVLTGTGKEKGIIGKSLSIEKEKFNEIAARKLQMAMLYYEDGKINPAKGKEFEKFAEEELKTATGEKKIRLKKQLEIYKMSQNLTPEQKEFVDNVMVKAFEEVAGDAVAAGVISEGAVKEHYIRRMFNIENDTFGSAKYGVKTFTTAKMQRKLETIFDGFMDGLDLKVSGIVNSYSEIAKEIATITANKNFIKASMESGVFTTDSKRKGFTQLNASGFTAWTRKAGAKIKTSTEEPGLLQVDSYGRKVFFAPPSLKFGAIKIGADRVSRYFETEEDAQAWIDERKGYTMEKVQQADVFEKVPLYAPERISNMLNAMTKTGSGLFETPVLKGLLRFNAGIKGWILLSSFFHHMAGQRSWSFGVDHEIASSLKQGNFVQAFKNIGTMVNSVSAHKRGLEKFQAGNAELSFLVKHGLTLGEMQDWSESLLRDQAGITETIAQKLGAEKISAGIEYGKIKREMFTNSLFKRYFMGLKSEAAVVMYNSELKKVIDKGGVPDTKIIAEKVAKEINADFGGLHLQRMGRNPDMQKMLRLLLLAPDWCFSSDIRVLCKDGWKYYNEVKAGDEILAFDKDKQTVQWEKIKEIYINENYDGPMVNLHNRGKDIRMTPDHRCFVFNKKTQQTETVLASELKPYHSIPRNAANGYDSPTEAIFSDTFIQLAGWFVTDGYTKKCVNKLSDGSDKEYRYGKITQAKPPTVEMIKDICPMKYHVEKELNPGGINKDGKQIIGQYKKHVFTIPKHYFEEMERLGLCDGLNWNFISKLTKSQLQLLYDTIYLADGTGQGRICGQEKAVFYTTMIQTMLGLPTTFYQQEEKCWRTRVLNQKNSMLSTNGKRDKVTQTTYKGTIWCPSIPSKYFMAEREGLMFITGNTESNFRTFTGMFPFGVNKKINELVGDMPSVPGMDKIYRSFWGGVIIKATIATILAQMAANLWDDDDRDWREEEFFRNFRRLKWTGVNVTGIYKSLGIDLKEDQRKIFSVVGHFADPLKAVNPEALIKGKGSPLTRIGESLITKSDWRERPYTSMGEWAATGKLRKKSRFEPKENFWEALPSIAMDQVVNMQPIQFGYLLRYMQGEEDGLSAIMSSGGAHISASYKPSDVRDMAETRKDIRTAYKRYLDKGKKPQDLLEIRQSLAKYTNIRVKSKERKDIPALNMQDLVTTGKIYLKNKDK